MPSSASNSKRFNSFSLSILATTAETSSFGNSATKSSIPFFAAASPLRTIVSLPPNPLEPSYVSVKTPRDGKYVQDTKSHDELKKAKENVGAFSATTAFYSYSCTICFYNKTKFGKSRKVVEKEKSEKHYMHWKHTLIFSTSLESKYSKIVIKFCTVV